MRRLQKVDDDTPSCLFLHHLFARLEGQAFTAEQLIQELVSIRILYVSSFSYQHEIRAANKWFSSEGRRAVHAMVSSEAFFKEIEPLLFQFDFTV